AVNALLLEYAASGLHITLYVFLTTCLLLTMYDLAARPRSPGSPLRSALPKNKLILAGILTGLLYLTDPIFFWIMPVILVLVIQLNPERRLQAALWFLLPLAVLVLPWMVRNGRL